LRLEEDAVTKRKLHVRPLKAIVRDPAGMRALPNDKTTEVPMNAYWLRRIRCGDVEKVEQKSATRPKLSKEGQEQS
jgi:hypothetical protein